MRFVSNGPALGLGAAVRERFVVTFGGDREQVDDSVSVKFTQDYITASDVEQALRQWPEKSFRGRWVHEDGITLQPLPELIGVYDTLEEQQRNGWSDEVRETVEKWMLAKPNLGHDFIQVDEPSFKAPWPNYDSTHHFRIPGLAAELGVIDEAVAYERATKNRESVLKSLEGQRGKPLPEPESEDLVAA